MTFYISSKGGYEPAWGPPTSTLNFCEEDYQFTPYVAELFNTLTNITYIGFGVFGILNNRRAGVKAISPHLPYVALINLGIASSAFHSSMKYYLQMFDEFSMLIATFIVCYRVLSFSQTRFSPCFLLVSLCSLMALVVIVQVSTGDSTLQQIVFVGAVFALWYTCFKLLASITTDPELKKRLTNMAIGGITIFVIGHLCWLTDFYACNSLRSIRKQIGMPWASILELHGFWHIFTGIGVYIFMVLAECLRFTSVAGDSRSSSMQLNVTGTWPFTVYLEKSPAGVEEDKKAK